MLALWGSQFVLRAVKRSPEIPVPAGIPAGIPAQKAQKTKGKPMLLSKKLRKPNENQCCCAKTSVFLRFLLVSGPGIPAGIPAGTGIRETIVTGLRDN